MWLQHTATSHALSLSKSLRPLGRMHLSCSWLRSACDLWLDLMGSQ